jgi:Holliday junction resolvasome RuvABC endonuclease subunit
MTIVSIDFSILFPGICIARDLKEFSWFAVVNSTLRKKDKEDLEALCIKYPSLKILKTQTKRKTQAEYHLTERNKLINYGELIEIIIQELQVQLKDDKEVIVCIEGISFGSKGNSLVDIAQSTGMLKQQLISKILKGDHDRFFVFTPGELKNAIGCKGNAGKLDVFNKFKEDPILEAVKKSDLFKAVNTEKWIVTGDKVISPVIDMVDSYLGIAKIYQLAK